MNNSIVIAMLFLLIAGLPIKAQLSGNNLMEYQFGNIPDEEPSDLSTLYNQLNLQYRQKAIKTSLRIEQFYSTDSMDRDYTQLSQFTFQYRYKRIELKVGNIYETLGRGLLFRSYEIPQSVKEERIFRARHGFYRDILGVSFRYRGEVFNLKAFRGKPLDNTFPPGNENRRTELIEAIQPEIRLGKQNFGLTGMRYNSQGQNAWYASLFGEGRLPWNFSYYTEYARNLTISTNPFSFDPEDSYGAYFSLNHSYGKYGASFELKKYQNLLIGTGITDPPTLVKEHSYRLLNRSTHVPELVNESGYQLEVYYNFTGGQSLTLNTAGANNEFLDEFSFREYFTELYWPFKSGSYIKIFADYSQEEIRREDNRYAAGIYYTHLLNKGWALSLESEYQAIDRENAIHQPINNVYLGLTIAKSTQYGLGLYYEYTTDETVADRSNTSEIESTKHFYGLTANYRPNSANAFSAFIGERRGGPACTAGVCYEVLDFRGGELRWTMKF